MYATAADSKPFYIKTSEASPRQIQLISDMAKERGIDITKRFDRPKNRDEATIIINWLKSFQKPQAAGTTSPTPSAPQDWRTDKSGKYMCEYFAVTLDGTLKFYRVKPGYKPGFYFIDVQASDEFHPIKNYGTKTIIMAAINDNRDEARKLYGQHIGHCGRCGRTLTDETSRAMGIGPDCLGKM